ncbi:MAG: fibronectin type III domain-containing protein, partial [Acidobacteriota bacterium]
ATAQEWLIAFWHHPPYTKGSHNSDTETELIEMRQNFLPILEDYGVDLVLTGHSHSYERSFLLDGHYGVSGTLAPSMIKNGGSGRPAGTGAYAKPTGGLGAHEGAVYAVAGSSGQASGGTLNHPAMFISLNQLGSMVLDVDGNRLDAKFLRETGAIDDSFTIVKGTAPTPTPTPIPPTATPTAVAPTATPTRTPTPIPPTATPTRTPTPIPPALPAAPSGLTATPVSRNRIDLAWQDNSGNETAFQIERSRSGGAFSLIATTAAGATSYSNTSGLTPGKLYSYRVRAVNAAGTSGYSNTASATTPKK